MFGPLLLEWSAELSDTLGLGMTLLPTGQLEFFERCKPAWVFRQAYLPIQKRRPRPRVLRAYDSSNTPASATQTVWMKRRAKSCIHQAPEHAERPVSYNLIPASSHLYSCPRADFLACCHSEQTCPTLLYALGAVVSVSMPSTRIANC